MKTLSVAIRLSLPLVFFALPALAQAQETSSPSPSLTSTASNTKAGAQVSAPATATASAPLSAEALAKAWRQQIVDHGYSPSSFFPPDACSSWSRAACEKECNSDSLYENYDCADVCSNEPCAAAGVERMLQLDAELGARWNEVEPYLTAHVRDGENVEELACSASLHEKGSHLFAKELSKQWVSGAHESDWLQQALVSSSERSGECEWLTVVARLDPPNQAMAESAEQLLSQSLRTGCLSASDIAGPLVRRYHGYLHLLEDAALVPALKTRLAGQPQAAEQPPTTEQPVLAERLSLARTLGVRVASRNGDLTAYLNALANEPEMRVVLLTQSVTTPHAARPGHLWPATGEAFSLWAEEFAGSHRSFAEGLIQERDTPPLQLCQRLNPGALSQRGEDGILWLLKRHSRAYRDLFKDCSAFQAARWEHWLIQHAESGRLDRSRLLSLLEDLGQGPLTSFAALSRPSQDWYQFRLIDLTCDRLAEAPGPHNALLAQMLADVDKYGVSGLRALFYCGQGDEKRRAVWANALTEALPVFAGKLDDGVAARELAGFLLKLPQESRKAFIDRFEKIAHATPEQPLLILAASSLRWATDDAKWPDVLLALDALVRRAPQTDLPRQVSRATDFLKFMLQVRFDSVEERDQLLLELAQAREAFEAKHVLHPQTRPLLDAVHAQAASWAPFVFSM